MESDGSWEEGRAEGQAERGWVRQREGRRVKEGRLTAPQDEQVLEDEAVWAPHLGQAEVWALVRGCMFAVV